MENLRLLTNMQDDQRNLFTLILAGQMELARRLEHPKRANLFQRIGTYGRIDKLPSEEAAKSYMEARLKLAGTQKKIFDDDAIAVIWEYSDQGIPRLINKICKLCLKAGETNGFQSISAAVTAQVAERFQKLSKTALQKRKPRNRPDPEYPEKEYSLIEETEKMEESFATPASTDVKIPNSISTPDIDIPIQTKPTLVDVSVSEINHEVSEEDNEPASSGQEIFEQVLIGEHLLSLTIPHHIIEQAKSSDRDSKNKLAGYWAAQIVKENPLLTQSPLVDPVSIWHDIKDIILKKMNGNPTANSMMAMA
jgi:hypothetical protein